MNAALPRRCLVLWTALPRRSLVLWTALPRRCLVLWTALPRRCSVLWTALPRRCLFLWTALPQRCLVLWTALHRRCLVLWTALPPRCLLLWTALPRRCLVLRCRRSRRPRRCNHWAPQLPGWSDAPPCWQCWTRCPWRGRTRPLCARAGCRWSRPPRRRGRGRQLRRIDTADPASRRGAATALLWSRSTQQTWYTPFYEQHLEKKGINNGFSTVPFSIRYLVETHVWKFW